MKQIALALAAMALMTPFTPDSALAQQAKRQTTVAILDLEANGVSDVEVNALSQRMQYEMFHTGVFAVMERGKMQEILREQGFQQTGACNTDACAVEVGQLIGVEKMVAGSLGRVGRTYTVILRLIDVRTGAVEQSVAQDYTGEIDRLLTSVLKNVAIKMALAVKESQQQAMAPGTLPEPVSRPIYKKWWFWGGIGGATAGGLLAALLGGKSTPAATTPPDNTTPAIDLPPTHQ